MKSCKITQIMQNQYVTHTIERRVLVYILDSGEERNRIVKVGARIRKISFLQQMPPVQGVQVVICGEVW